MPIAIRPFAHPARLCWLPICRRRRRRRVRGLRYRPTRATFFFLSPWLAGWTGWLAGPFLYLISSLARVTFSQPFFGFSSPSYSLSFFLSLPQPFNPPPPVIFARRHRPQRIGNALLSVGLLFLLFALWFSPGARRAHANCRQEALVYSPVWYSVRLQQRPARGRPFCPPVGRSVVVVLVYSRPLPTPFVAAPAR